MAAPFAFVTLITSDAYLPGALALAGALKDVHPRPLALPEVDFQTVCLVTPETVDVSTVKLLRRAFNIVVGVELITQENNEGLKLLGRPDLNTVLTKLHIFRLTQFSKIIFFDADVLPIRPLSHLFTLPHEFSAVPDVGWPDIFNSGVLVLSPGEDKFTELTQLLKSKGSWDGGDQGLLNEWRGGNWNRLSFTYNTTPTAAYTYAPAYERFGSQISAIHFIGPNKPWSAIPYRAPGSATTEQQAALETQQAYDYASLVDRWFSVYDRHYRAHAIVPETEFEVRRYVSAWDEQSATGAELVGASSAHVGSVLGLEDLKRLALEGMNTSSVVSEDRGGEGEYQSLPLEGRVDLMRPKQEPVQSEPETWPEPEPEPELQQPQTRHDDFGSPTTPVQRHVSLDDESPPRFETLPTPGPNEIPPAPRSGVRSLPASVTSTPTPQPSRGREPPPEIVHYHGQHDEEPKPHSQHQTEPQHQPQSQHQPQPQPQPRFHLQLQSEQQQTHVERSRPSSPPLLVWNPAIEPPPKSTPQPSAFPSDTYFPNIWDQSPSKRNDETHQSFSSPEQQNVPDSRAFFQAPPPSEIPELLLRQGHYRNVTGPQSEENLGASPSPDRSKVKRVFPWEEKPRQLPGRVFPTSDSPAPGLFIDSKATPSPPPISTPERRGGAPPALIPSPLIGLPSTLTYANAWDTVPSIQKYASRLIRPAPTAAPLAPAFESAGRRRRASDGYRNREDRAEVSSRDGDVEDEGDDEDAAEEPSTARWYDESPGDEGAVKTRSRGSSRGGSSSPRTYVGKKREYRSQGVQTIPKSTRSMGVQVDTASAKSTPRGQRDQPEVIKPRPQSASLGGRRQWAPATGSNILPPVVMQEVDSTGDKPSTASLAVTQPGLSLTPFPKMEAEPAGMRSPREFTFSPSSHSPMQVVTPPLRNSPPESLRKLSNETLTSPLSSVGPVSPAEGQPIALPAAQRKAGRVFDPARGVELFKRGSEEVLARFLRMGSWEDEVVHQA